MGFAMGGSNSHSSLGKRSWSALRTSASALRAAAPAPKSDMPNLDEAIEQGHPQPNAWAARRWAEVNGHLIVEVAYAGVRNYEGRKVMLFERGVRIGDLVEQKLLDPHFIEPEKSRYIHPIARFEPTERGWRMAGALAESSEKWSNK